MFYRDVPAAVQEGMYNNAAELIRQKQKSASLEYHNKIMQSANPFTTTSHAPHKRPGTVRTYQGQGQGKGLESHLDSTMTPCPSAVSKNPLTTSLTVNMSKRRVDHLSAREGGHTKTGESGTTTSRHISPNKSRNLTSEDNPFMQGVEQFSATAVPRQRSGGPPSNHHTEPPVMRRPAARTSSPTFMSAPLEWKASLEPLRRSLKAGAEVLPHPLTLTRGAPPAAESKHVARNSLLWAADPEKAVTAHIVGPPTARTQSPPKIVAAAGANPDAGSTNRITRHSSPFRGSSTQVYNILSWNVA